MNVIDIYLRFTALQAKVDSVMSEGTRLALNLLHLIFDKLFYILLFIAIIVSISYLFISVYVMFFNKKKQDTREFDPEKAPFVSIQIPTYNELVSLRCAQSCLEFDYPKDKYEIIIGDDSNKKEISMKIDSFAKQHSIVKVTRRGSNEGYKEGQGGA